MLSVCVSYHHYGYRYGKVSLILGSFLAENLSGKFSDYFLNWPLFYLKGFCLCQYTRMSFCFLESVFTFITTMQSYGHVCYASLNCFKRYWKKQEINDIHYQKVILMVYSISKFSIFSKKSWKNIWFACS